MWRQDECGVPFSRNRQHDACIAEGFTLGAHGRGAHPIDRWPYTIEDETVEHHYLTAVGLAEYICEWYLMGGRVIEPEPH